MDKYKCKLCTRTFNNGRALGGHMKAHLAISSNKNDQKQRISHPTTEKSLVYELRENPKQSCRFSDHSRTQIPSFMIKKQKLSDDDVALCLMMLSRDVWDDIEEDEAKRLKFENLKSGFRSCKGMEKRVFKCSFCCRVFSSGQALGGHKRSHLLVSSSSSSALSSKNGFSEQRYELIDLNLPAPPTDDDDMISVVLDS